MTLDTSLPPPMFDLEPEPTAAPVGRRPGHQIRVHNAWPSGQFIACTCAEQSPPSIARIPDALTRWAYQHLGVEYDTDVARAVRPTCDVSWIESDPALPHDEHHCVFHTQGPHARHECRCGLNRHTDERAS